MAGSPFGSTSAPDRATYQTDKDGSEDPQIIDYAYDLGGNQTQWSSPGRTRQVNRAFDPNGELAQRRAIRLQRGSQTVNETRTYDYERNPAGELTKLIDQDPPRPSPENDPSARTTSITRDVAGRIRGVNETWEGGRDTLYRYMTGGLVEQTSVDGQIQRGASGNISGFSGGRSTTTSYDNLDRVKDTTVEENTTGSAPRTTSYTYWPWFASDSTPQIAELIRPHPTGFAAVAAGGRYAELWSAWSGSRRWRSSGRLVSAARQAR